MFALRYFDVSGFLEVASSQLGEFYFLAVWGSRPRDIKVTHCKHKVSHFIQIIFYTWHLE